MTEQEIIELIKQGKPFEGLSNIRILGVEVEPWQNIPDKNARPDVALSLEFSGTKILLYGEIKTQITPKMLAKEIAPWLVKINLNNPPRRYILICPFLSPESQKYCQENNIGFIDMCGNIFINIPGTILIQRLNQPNIFKTPRLLRDPFFGASSRVVRVLLKAPNKRWSVTEIQQELITQGKDKYFQISLSSISKTVQSLEEALLIRRDGLKIVVPDPKQLLFNWAERYQKRYRWSRYSSQAWRCNNPFGFDVKSSVKGLLNQFQNLETIITGSAAASLTAPFVTIDQIDIFILNNFEKQILLDFTDDTKEGKGPEFLFIYPYDRGVALYSRKTDDVDIASDIQIYLDCYARGGRDAKQAEYLLTNSIEQQWNQK